MERYPKSMEGDRWANPRMIGTKPKFGFGWLVRAVERAIQCIPLWWYGGSGWNQPRWIQLVAIAIGTNPDTGHCRGARRWFCRPTSQSPLPPARRATQ